MAKDTCLDCGTSYYIKPKTENKSIKKQRNVLFNR